MIDPDSFAAWHFAGEDVKKTPAADVYTYPKGLDRSRDLGPRRCARAGRPRKRRGHRTERKRRHEREPERRRLQRRRRGRLGSKFLCMALLLLARKRPVHDPTQ